MQAMAFLRRDWLVESSYRSTALFGFLGRLASLLMFFFLGKAVGTSAHLEPYGGAYFAFALLGIAAQEPLHAAVSQMAAKVREAQLTGTLEAVLATPIGPARAVALSTLFPLLTSSARMLIFLAVGVGLGAALMPSGVLVAAVALTLALVAYGAMGMLAASFTLVLKRGDPLSSAVHVLSALLGGVLYPVSVLPGSLQALAQWLPLTHTLEAIRLALLTDAPGAEAWWAVGKLAGLTLVLLPIAGMVFARALDRAKREGSLTHF